MHGACDLAKAVAAANSTPFRAVTLWSERRARGSACGRWRTVKDPFELRVAHHAKHVEGHFSRQQRWRPPEQPAHPICLRCHPQRIHHTIMPAHLPATYPHLACNAAFEQIPSTLINEDPDKGRPLFGHYVSQSSKVAVAAGVPNALSCRA